jgi:hypothetical protein
MFAHASMLGTLACEGKHERQCALGSIHSCVVQNCFLKLSANVLYSAAVDKHAMLMMYTARRRRL